MSKIDVLLHNPENYKTICSIVERNQFNCDGCIVFVFCGLRSNKVFPIIPYRSEIAHTIGLLNHE